ncbi:hypothetical protein GWI33_013053 [Rhynchophorus ferrugineus]|uniref:Uncharacterized protein n=1 Tax=Rhynchophorus ferrugineus TaxID=354439 RepID=A0A834I787_RHYFE|nr:hypothetical protein GWI33_013053 [Rhynchophorus ferrugineus]
MGKLLIENMIRKRLCYRVVSSGFGFHFLFGSITEGPRAFWKPFSRSFEHEFIGNGSNRLRPPTTFPPPPPQAAPRPVPFASEKLQRLQTIPLHQISGRKRGRRFNIEDNYGDRPISVKLKCSFH